MSTILEARNLCKSYSNGKVMQHVLKNLNLSIKEGDFTVIMGSSGSGKSTLLYAISGMDQPTLGTIEFKGTEISGYTNDQLAVFRRKNCGFVFQQMYLNDTMSILDNIVVCGLLQKRNRKEVVEEAKRLVTKQGTDR